jgi:hypothetical protein
MAVDGLLLYDLHAHGAIDKVAQFIAVCRRSK